MTNRTQITDEDGSRIDQDDAPITSLAEDRLGRRIFARELAAEVMAAPASRGYVMGLTGAWGSGKTSILNMTVDAIGDDAVVVQFNPWMFSGTEALVSSFFDEIGRQLDGRDSKFKAIAGKLSTYGRLLSPLASFVGAAAALSGAAEVLAQMAEKPSVFDQRRELRSMLEKLEKRLVVVVDDVDRLRPQEVLDIVRLVRLVGDFPNTLYLLAFDRGRVEECLGEGSLERGRAYLEKIVQVTHDVPLARQPDVTSIFVASLGDLIETATTGPLDSGDWQNIFTFVIRPLITTPRHVRRLLASLSMTMRLVGDEVALADLVGMESLRVLKPEMFQAVVSVADYLSAESAYASQSGYHAGRNAADSPLAPMYQVDPDLAENVCRWLFPSARRFFENMHHGPEWEGLWRRQRKVGSAAVAPGRTAGRLPDGVVPARAVDEALSMLDDRDGLQAGLDVFGSSELMDLIERMNPALEEIPVDGDHIGRDPARVALPVLLDMLDRLRDDGLHARGFSGSMTVMRAALRLLRRIADSNLRTDIIRGVFDDTRSRSGRLILLLVVGHRENIGNDLLDAAVAKALEDQLRDDLIGMAAADFAGESRPLRLAGLMAETDMGLAALKGLAEDDRVTLSLFTAVVSETFSHATGAAAVEVTKVLAWDYLAGWFGEDMLIRRTAELMAAVDEDGMTVSAEERLALDLAAAYATGNRPESSFDRIRRIYGADNDSSHADGEDDARSRHADEDFPGDM